MKSSEKSTRISGLFSELVKEASPGVQTYLLRNFWLNEEAFVANTCIRYYKSYDGEHSFVSLLQGFFFSVVCTHAFTPSVFCLGFCAVCLWYLKVSYVYEYGVVMTFILTLVHRDRLAGTGPPQNPSCIRI